MTYSDINYLAVVIAAIAGFMTGAAWYGVLGKQWMAAVGLTEKQVKANPSPAPFILAGLANLIMALMLAGILAHMGRSGLINGVLTGLSVWFGFILTTITVNYAFASRPRALTFIDTGHWLAVLTVIGAIIGAMSTA